MPFGPSDRIDFKSIATPTHILAGTGDLILDDRRQAGPLAKILPNARLTLLERIGHMLHHSATGVLVGAVEQALPGASLRPLAG
jgi:pimeloyl-ACP methyl ester carboxylesterase